VVVASLDEDLAAYQELHQALESDYMGKWALVHDRKLVSLFDTFEQAAETAVEQFGRGPYLIRQIGAPPVILPASIMYTLPAPRVDGVDGQNKVRI
jgi:hypothetical protein